MDGDMDKTIVDALPAIEEPEAEKKASNAPVSGKRKAKTSGWHDEMPPMPEVERVTIGTAAIDGELAAADVAAVLATRVPQLGWCAKFATPDKPIAHGAFELRLVLDDRGEVIIARLQDRDSLDTRFVHCVETTAARSFFGESKSGSLPIVVVPFGVGATKPAAASKIDEITMTELRRGAAAIVADRRAVEEAQRKRQAELDAAAAAEQAELQRTAGSPYSGKLFDVMGHLAAGRRNEALELAGAWQLEQPGDVLALVALGEVAENAGDRETAARAYGSIVDLFPSRADLRRYASYRLARVGGGALEVAIDSAREAVASRPDHPSSHRALAFALVAAGKHREAAQALVAGLHAEHVAWDRFTEVQRILREDLALVGAAWAAADSSARAEIDAMLRNENVSIASSPSLRFVLTWETDANDVDFHIHDGKGGHAFFSDKVLPSGGSLYADITTGYGPECFAIEGVAAAYPYNLRAHYYSRGPMGYGMGRVQAVQHDGKGGLVLREYPFVVMKDQEWIDLGTITGPLL
jgi:tetratricopeptide (TPR) repeat protein